MRLSKFSVPVVAMSLLVAGLSAQTPGRVQAQSSGDRRIYRITVNVVERATSAVNYEHRGGSTRLDFRGTSMLPKAHGEAEVTGRKGYLQIKTEFKDMKP